MDKEWRPGERKTEAPKTERKAAAETWGEQQQKNLPSWWWIPLAVIGIIIIAAVLLRGDEEPICVSGEAQDQTALTAAQTELQNCQQTLAATQQPAEECSETAFRVLRADLAQCTRDLELTKEKIDDTKDEAESQEAVIADAARRICCAQRIENSAINSYSIDDDKIICTTDGETPIGC